MKHVYRVSDHPVKEINKVYINNIHKTIGFTSYTGQVGDEYTGYKGGAVIVFNTLTNKNESKKV